MYSPHSYVTIFAFTPIFAQSAWIISAIRRAFVVRALHRHRPQRDLETVREAGLREQRLAFAVSFGAIFRFLSYDHWVGGIGALAALPAPW